MARLVSVELSYLLLQDHYHSIHLIKDKSQSLIFCSSQLNILYHPCCVYLMTFHFICYRLYNYMGDNAISPFVINYVYHNGTAAPEAADQSTQIIPMSPPAVDCNQDVTTSDGVS